MFPLLGLLALGATAAGKPFYDDWIEGREGRQADRALEGAGSDPLSQNRALLSAGLLSPESWATLGQDESQFGRSLAQDESQFGRSMAQDESQFGRQLGQNQSQFETGLQFDREGRAFDYLATLPNAWIMPGGLTPVPMLDGTTTSPTAINLPLAMQALSNGESGGDPSVINSIGATGEFQIMPENIGPWSERVLGYAMTQEEFRNNPDAQYEIASTIFAENVQRYGLADAYSIWHSGVPLAQAIREGRTDGNMTTVDYVRQMLGHYGQLAGTQAAVDQRAAFDRTPIGQDALRFGPAWATMEPAQRENVLRMRRGAELAADVLDYVGDSTALGRLNDDQTSAEWDTRYRATMLPALKDMLGMGTLSDSDIALMESIMGDPLSMGQLTDSEQGRVRGILTMFNDTIRDQQRALGLNDVPVTRDSVPEGLIPGR